MRFLVGVDIGGTNVVAGLLDDEGNLLHKIKQPTEAARGRHHVIRKIGQTVQALLTHSQTDSRQVMAVGMGVPGFIDPHLGISIYSVNLGWRNEKVAEKLTEMLGIPVFIDNDVRMYVYGEAVKGSGQGYDHVLGITLGTGLAAAMINKRVPYYGGHFMAGELGHIRLEGEDMLCKCGMRGCLETVASATGIANLAKRAITEGQESVLKQWFDGESLWQLTASDVSKAYDAGDELAKQVFHHAGNQLGRGLSYAVTLFSPDVVVIGGGAALAGDRLFQPMREELKRSLLPAYWERISIKTAELLDDAGVVGSALYARQRASAERSGKWA